jgi:hypothetical protein
MSCWMVTPCPLIFVWFLAVNARPGVVRVRAHRGIGLWLPSELRAGSPAVLHQLWQRSGALLCVPLRLERRLIDPDTRLMLLVPRQ